MSDVHVVIEAALRYVRGVMASIDAPEEDRLEAMISLLGFGIDWMKGRLNHIRKRATSRNPWRRKNPNA